MEAEGAARRVALTGWGRTSPSVARVVRPATAAQVDSALAAAGPRGIVARGLGRSYGDAAQNAGGEVVDTTGLDQIVSVDADGLTVTAGAGVSLGRLMAVLLPLGLWPAVTPGTRHVSAGGAIAADVHGKNHHRDGSFGARVASIVLHTPGAGIVVAGPNHEADVLWATVGGMGLTGVITEATIGLVPVETATMRVDTERLADLDHLLARMVEADASYRYSVAWIDCLARGRRLGRSVLELAEHARLDDLPPGRRGPSQALRWSPGGRLAVPGWVPGVLNRRTVTAFNELWYRKAPRHRVGQLVPIGAFFHPLDAVGGWNHLYGRRGFVQHQLVVPDGAELSLRRCLEWFSDAGAASFLSVLKRFGPASPGLLSFPRPGWTLAVDIPAAAPGLGSLLDQVDTEVAAAGGRVYLAKDSRLRPDLLETMYPELPRWREIRDRLDPQRRMRSDLARRLPLLEAARTLEAAGKGDR